MTYLEFGQTFPHQDACLEYIFNQKYTKQCSCGGRYYRLRRRKTYGCSRCRNQLSPLAETIFHKSRTDLRKWFFAIYLISHSKHGVSAMELKRNLGVTFKTAWRINKQIRTLMGQGTKKLNGIVEVDETYFGGRSREEDKFKEKSAIMGMVERGGRLRAHIIPSRQTHIILNKVRQNISKDAHIMSDEAGVYKKLHKLGYQSSRIKHGKKHWVRGNIYTNTIEGAWSQLKRGISGTHHAVSKKHLQSYVDAQVFSWNYRNAPRFEVLLGRV